MSDSGPSTPKRSASQRSTPKRSTSKRLTPGRSGRSTPTSQTPLNITPSTAAKYHKALTEYHFQIFTECIDPDTGVVDLEQLQERMMSNATTFTKYSASKLTDINLVISLLDIEYHPTRAEELWLPPEHAVVIPDQFEHVLDCFLTTIQWDVACCEAMARTVIDIVSLPLLRRSVSDLPQSSLPLALDVRIRGGIEIGTRLVTTPGLITGVADYVLGRFQFAKFVGYSVILEAKKIDTYYQAIPQLAAYMVGIAQAREREGFEVGTVYGVLTTGSVWRFLKLNGNNLRQSKSYELVEPREKQIICSFLYEIFSAAISTPLIKKAESHNNVFGTDFSPVL